MQLHVFVINLFACCITLYSANTLQCMHSLVDGHLGYFVFFFFFAMTSSTATSIIFKILKIEIYTERVIRNYIDLICISFFPSLFNEEYRSRDAQEQLEK